MRLLPPVPFSRLGDAPSGELTPSDCLVRTPYPELLALAFLIPLSELLCFTSRFVLLSAAFPLMSDVEADVDNGLGGRLLTRGFDLGGFGNAPMLVVLRTVLPGVGIAEEGGDVVAEPGFDIVVVLRVGTAGVDCVCTGFGVGRPEVVTDRVRGLLIGVAIEEDAEPGREVSGISGKGFRVFAIGNAGKGPVGGADGGGALVGRCGIADVIVAVRDMDKARYQRLSRCTFPPPPFVLLPKRW